MSVPKTRTAAAPKTPPSAAPKKDEIVSAHVSPAPDENALISRYGIRDVGGVVYFAYVMQGVITLFPWVMMTTASPFYSKFKFRYVTSSVVNDSALAARMENYNYFFVSFLGLVCKGANLLGNLLTLLVISTSNYRPRILICDGVIVYFNLFIMTVVVSDSRSWPELGFWLTLLGASGLSTTVGLLTAFVWGSIASFPGKENAVQMGDSVSGILGALISILSKVTWLADSWKEFNIADERLSAFIYFNLSLFASAATWVVFASLKFNKFYRFVERNRDRAGHTKNRQCAETSRKLGPIFAKSAGLQMGLVALMVVTLCCFPTLQIAIVPERSFPIPALYPDLVIFLNFNVASLLGNFLTMKAKCLGPKTIWILLALRFLFIPILVFCNYRPKVRTVPVLFYNDAVHAIVSFLLGFSNGYLVTILLELVHANALHHGFDSGLALKLAGTMMIVGIIVGLSLGMLIERLIEL